MFRRFPDFKDYRNTAFYNENQMAQIFSFSYPIDWHWLWLTVAAFLAGALNAVAGGGSFLLFPAMLSMKILPVQANATNSVALWPGQLTSVAAYREDIQKNLRLAWLMGLAGLRRRHWRCSPVEYAAEDLYGPGSLAAPGGRLNFCRQRPGLPLARPAQRFASRRNPSPAPPADLPHHHRGLFLYRLLWRRRGFSYHYPALHLRLPGSERNQCPQGGLHHSGRTVSPF